MEIERNKTANFTFRLAEKIVVDIKNLIWWN